MWGLTKQRKQIKCGVQQSKESRINMGLNKINKEEMWGSAKLSLNMGLNKIKEEEMWGSTKQRKQIKCGAQQNKESRLNVRLNKTKKAE